MKVEKWFNLDGTPIDVFTFDECKLDTKVESNYFTFINRLNEIIDINGNKVIVNPVKVKSFQYQNTACKRLIILVKKTFKIDLILKIINNNLNKFMF